MKSGVFQPSAGPNGILRAIHAVRTLGARVVQVFLSNPRALRLRTLTDREVAAVRSALSELEMEMFIHSPYVINLARPLGDVDRDVEFLARELLLAERLGAKGCIVHLGKALGRAPEVAERYFAESVRRVLLERSVRSGAPVGRRPWLILETSAGQGTEMLARVGELCRWYGASFTEAEKEELGVCLDTCHVFAAGNTLEEVVGAIGATVGWGAVKCFHLNNSRKGFGSRVDRHEELDKGMIPVEAVAEWVKIARARDIPVILETPDVSRYPDHLAFIHSLSGGA